MLDRRLAAALVCFAAGCQPVVGQWDVTCGTFESSAVDFTVELDSRSAERGETYGPVGRALLPVDDDLLEVDVFPGLGVDVRRGRQQVVELAFEQGTLVLDGEVDGGDWYGGCGVDDGGADLLAGLLNLASGVLCQGCLGYVDDDGEVEVLIEPGTLRGTFAGRP